MTPRREQCRGNCLAVRHGSPPPDLHALHFHESAGRNPCPQTMRDDHRDWHAYLQVSAILPHWLRDTPPIFAADCSVLPNCHCYSFQQNVPASPATTPASREGVYLPGHPLFPRLS